MSSAAYVLRRPAHLWRVPARAIEPIRAGVRLILTGRPRIQDLCTSAFDALAASYDETFTDTLIGRTLRELVWVRLEPLFRDSRRILELGCGTGEDAIRLARLGKHVVAADISPEMIREAARKASADLQAATSPEFHCVSMEALSSTLAGRTFDGVLSNFGALNCVRDLPGLVSSVAARLEPGSPLLWVLMGRHVPWEWFWFLARGRRDKAWRRLHRDGTQWRGASIHYPTPGRIAALLQPYFCVCRIAPLGFALPPSYASAWLDSSPHVGRVLTRIERLAQACPALARLADHYMIEAVRLPRVT